MLQEIERVSDIVQELPHVLELALDAFLSCLAVKECLIVVTGNIPFLAGRAWTLAIAL